MSDPTDLRYLDLFANYLQTLGEDAAALGKVVESSTADSKDAGLTFVVSSLNYIFKSLDLIPDGIDDLGFMDDAFVLRISASFAAAGEDASTLDPTIARLATEAADVRTFLEADADKLDAYVRSARRGSARGRTVEAILDGDDAQARTDFVREVGAWALSYEPPSFTRDIKTLIKLKSFLNAKLS